MSKGEPALLLDIDSSSLGVCILDNDGERPQLSLTNRVSIGTGVTRDPNALIPLLKEALTQTLPQYAKAYPHVRKVYVVAASPWFDATVRTLSSKSEKPVKVTDSSIKKIVADHRKTEHEAAGKTTIEAVPVTVLVNGYRTLVHKPVFGNSLSVTVYESIVDQTFMQTVHDAVRTVLPRAQLTWHSTPLAYAETLLRLSGEDHATVVDVGGEVSDVMVLSHQNISYVGSIPGGARTIARAVSGKAGNLPDALSRLAMFARGELSQKEMEATALALTNASKEWQGQFSKLLAEAGNTVPVPHRVFLVGERDELPWFAQVVTGVETRGQRQLAQVIGADFFTGLLGYGEGGVFDASLALDALFFHMRVEKPLREALTPPMLYSIQ